MSDYARGGDNFDYEPEPKKCIYENCKNEVHISKAGNKMDVCKEHLTWLYETKIPKENKINEINNNLSKIYNYLISIEKYLNKENQ